MRYAHIINYFNSSPTWAILPEKLYAIMELLELKAQGITFTPTEIEARVGPRRGANSRGQSTPTIAVLPIFGTIAHRAGLLHNASGGMSVEAFSRDFRAAVHDPDVRAIVLDIDSPGGSTSGIEELASQVFEARSEKRIIASVNSLAASAAYWIAASAHEIALTPSGHVGSIGVMGVHMDFSEKAKRDGVAVSIVSAGKFKAEGHQFRPLSAEAMTHMQALVDDRYEAFVRAVARGRGVAQRTVREGFGQGRVVPAREALSQGMVDAIETQDDTISRTVARAQRARTVAESTSWLISEDDTLEHELRVLGETNQAIQREGRQQFVVQSISVAKASWDSLDAARSWARSNGYRAERCQESERSWRFIQRDADDFKALRNVQEGGVVMTGGPLKPDAASHHAPAMAGVDEVLLVGVVPENVSDTIAPDDTSWSAPTLSDFTDKPWGELTDAEKRRIAGHYAWARAVPPENFGDLKLPHHRPSDGAIVPRGVQAALARVNQTQELGEDRPRVEAHLRAHMNRIQERRNTAMANPALDPDNVAIELFELDESRA